MKKTHLLVASGFLFMAGLVWAANQYNWGNSTGGAWSTPDDTKTTAGQVLQIGASGGSTVVAAATPLTLFSGSSTTIAALTPATTGQLVFLLNGTLNNVLCISTGSSANQWALVQATNTSCR